MCGIFAAFLSNKKAQAYPYILNGLTVLQHRGQDAAGIHTCDETVSTFPLGHKGVGKVDKVFDSIPPTKFPGNYGIGHVRYCTAGSLSVESAQPLNNDKISLVHNGNLTNTEDLIQFLNQCNVSCSTQSDSEILLQVFDFVLRMHTGFPILTNTAIFCAVKVIMQLCKGSYSVAVMIQDFGIVAFRDPRGIRPLCIGKRADEFTGKRADGGYAFASESVALQSVGFDLIGDVLPGECITVTDYGLRREMMLENNPLKHQVATLQVATLQVATLPVATLTPCLFEYIYFARPESTIDGILVYQARKNMGEALANKILRDHPDLVAEIDVVMPVPDSARISALRASYILQKPYCEGLIKNAYVGRTFIMPSQQERKKTLKMKLNTIDQEFRDKVVLIIDDSIVRGNTSMQIIEIIRKAGATRIIFASIAPPVRYPNVYGIAIPTESELIASGDRTEEDIAALIGADMVIFNDLQDVVESCNKCNECNGKINPNVRGFEVSCFSIT
jgi:amidophosphoribosyltransferase